jgi:hypothetical protein
MSDKHPTILEKPASRREVMKKAAYMTPVILTLAAVPSFAGKGSGNRDNGNRDNGNQGRGRRRKSH